MELFDKGTLTSVIFCAALMSAVDGDVDKEEWDVIKNFINDYWSKDFGDFTKIQSQIAANVKKIMHNRKEMNTKLNKLVKILQSKLTTRQKEVLLRLVEEVMMADRKISPKEEKLLDQLITIMDMKSR
jgi:tellurite resistance protein